MAALVFSDITSIFVIGVFLPAGLALASGLAATVTITHMLKTGDGIICMDDVYGGETMLYSLDEAW